MEDKQIAVLVDVSSRGLLVMVLGLVVALGSYVAAIFLSGVM